MEGDKENKNEEKISKGINIIAENAKEVLKIIEKSKTEKRKDDKEEER